MLLNTSVAMLLAFRHVLGQKHAVERSSQFKAMLERVKLDRTNNAVAAWEVRKNHLGHEPIPQIVTSTTAGDLLADIEADYF